MAVGIRINLPGVGVEEFDRIDAAVNARDDHPDGLIFSASGPVDGAGACSTSGSPARSSTPLQPSALGLQLRRLGAQLDPRSTSFPSTSTSRGRRA
jgi:hypothetical protein